MCVCVWDYRLGAVCRLLGIRNFFKGQLGKGEPPL